MNYFAFDFPFILTMLVLITGLITAADIFFLKKRREGAKQPGRRRAAEKKTAVKKTVEFHQPWYIEYARSFFPVLLLVWIIRSFLFQPYRVPTASLEPTVMPGDFILVNQYDYGLRFPVINDKFLTIGEPNLGDIALFHWPVHPEVLFVKRIVGTPGDHLVYKNKVLYINGKKMKQTFVRDTTEMIPNSEGVPVVEMQENLMGVVHDIYVRPNAPAQDFDVVVPEGHYFAMGDNRDDSDDSRYWGFVPEDHLVGKALRILISWNPNENNFRWRRFGGSLYHEVMQ